jgi:bacteriorhodopsin
MNLIGVVITLIVVGVLLWLMNSYIPMQASIKKIINILVIVCVVLWLLFSVFGLGADMGNVTVPHAHH